MTEVRAWAEQTVIPTYEVGEPEENPIFLEKRVYQGSSGKVYPYPTIDKIGDRKVDKTYTAVYLENVQDPDPAAILEVLEKTDHPLFKACLDIGHLKCHSSQSPREWIRILGGRIGHVHLHDNDGMSDLHLGIKGEDRELLDLIGQIRTAAPGAGFVLEIGEEGELVRTLEILQQAGVWAGEGENS